jgi:hypothetical protein
VYLVNCKAQSTSLIFAIDPNLQSCNCDCMPLYYLKEKDTLGPENEI